MVESKRARGAFLGLAAGDAWGRPLEFLRLPGVRTATVDTRPGHFRWTDDTHMALYLAEALFDLPPRSLAAGAVDEDALGHAIARRFVTWSHDPLTPSTAPGNTCLAGTARYERRPDWRKSGIESSDGCGAVMRITPLAIALSGEELAQAADISARVTHAHPNAVAAAVAGAWLLRRVMEAGALTPGMVEEVAAAVAQRCPEGTDVPLALRAAIGLGARSGEWLEEKEVPAGDGGWRSPSALGLAVAAALRWGGPTPEAFALAVEKAARIEGDSDSVACLTGTLLGGAHGEAVVPLAWRAALPEAARMRALAHRLRALDEARHAPPRLRTSLSDPLRVNDVIPGSLGITFLPGKRGASAFGSGWLRDLDTDLDALAAAGTTLLLSLVEDHELVELGSTALVPEAEARGIRVVRGPIVDVSVPSVALARALVAAATEEIAAGGRVVVHCRGGLGRAGTIAACILIALGRTPKAALAEVRAARPGAVETRGQEAFVEAFSPG